MTWRGAGGSANTPSRHAGPRNESGVIRAPMGAATPPDPRPCGRSGCMGGRIKSGHDVGGGGKRQHPLPSCRAPGSSPDLIRAPMGAATPPDPRRARGSGCMGGRIKSGHDVGGRGSPTPTPVMPGPRIESGGDPGTHGRRPPLPTGRCTGGASGCADQVRAWVAGSSPGLDPGTGHDVGGGGSTNTPSPSCRAPGSSPGLLRMRVWVERGPGIHPHPE